MSKPSTKDTKAVLLAAAQVAAFAQSAHEALVRAGQHDPKVKVVPSVERLAKALGTTVEALLTVGGR